MDSKNRFPFLRLNSGFTLVEIMVVVVIIGLLASVAVGVYISNIDKARKNITIVKIAAISEAVQMFKLNHSRFPSSLDELVNKPSDVKEEDWQEGGYLKEDTVDSWGNKFDYKLESNKYTITSYGADGKPGGDGFNADLTNHDKPEKK